MAQYNDSLQQYFNDRRYVGTLTGPSIRSAQHDLMDVQLRFYLDIHNDIIQHVRYKVMGPPPVIAACAWLAEQIDQQPTETLANLTPAPLMTAFSLADHQQHQITLVIRIAQQCLDL